MKVIAKIPVRFRDDSLVVEMTYNEWKKLAGDAHQGITAEVGTTLNVDKLYDRIKSIERNRDKLASVRQNLIAIASLLEPLEGVVGCDPQPETNEAESNG